MTNKYGLFVNLDYAHKPQSECSMVWQKISDTLLQYGFSFQKRAFTINTEKSREALSFDVRALFDDIQAKQNDFYSHIIDCYILNYEHCTDLTLPDTSNSIDVEDISLEELNTIGIDYDLLFKKNS